MPSPGTQKVLLKPSSCMKRKTALERKLKKAREMQAADRLYNLIGREKYDQLLRFMQENNMTYLDFGELKEHIREREEKRGEKFD